jgi:hypothetical protein
MADADDGTGFDENDRYLAAIHDLENASFDPRCGVASLIENPPHEAIALRRRCLWLTPALSLSPGHTPTQEHSCL